MGLTFEEEHQDFLDALQRGDWDEILCMMARGAGKSTIVAGYFAWEIAKNRDILILLVGVSYEKAEELTWLARQYLENPQIIEWFGDFKTPFWSKGEFVVSGRTQADRSATLRAMGRDSFKPGGHFDIVWFDDVEDHETTSTPEQIAKTQEVDSLAYPMNDRPGAKRGTTGTYWDDGDLYSYKGKLFGLDTYDDLGDGRVLRRRVNGTFRHVTATLHDGRVVNKRVLFFFKPALKPDGSAMFPTRVTAETVAFNKMSMTASRFASQYLLDPISSETQIFRPEDMEYVTTRPAVADRYALFDLARSKAKRADSIGFCQVDVDPTFTFTVTDARSMKRSGRQVIDLVFDLHAGAPDLQFVIEEDGYGAGLKVLLDEEMVARRTFPSITWINAHGRQRKTDRIEALEPHFRAKRVKLMRGCQELEDQLLRFPKSEKKDVADAFANLLEVVSRPLQPTETPKSWGKFTISETPLTKHLRARAGTRNPGRMTTEKDGSLAY